MGQTDSSTPRGRSKQQLVRFVIWQELASRRCVVFPKFAITAYDWLTSPGVAQVVHPRLGFGSQYLTKKVLMGVLVVHAVWLSTAFYLGWLQLLFSLCLGVALWKRLFARHPGDRHQIYEVHDLPKAGSSLDVLSFNLFLRSPASPGGSAGYGTEEYKDQRLDQIVSRIVLEHQGCDVVCVQEIFSYGCFRQEKLLAGLYKAGFQYYAAAPGAPWMGHYGTLDGIFDYLPGFLKWIDGGLMIVSKYPILQTHFHGFQRSAGGDMMINKGVLHAKIRLGEEGSRCLDVFNCHLQSSQNVASRDASTPLERALRRRQIGELLEFVHQYAAPSAPLLLCGDWNIDAHANRGDLKIKSPLGQLSLGAEGSPEYRDLVRHLEDGLPGLTVRDVVLESTGFHPVTFGNVNQIDGALVPNDTILTDPDEVGCQAFLDYVLLCEPGGAKATLKSKIDPFPSSGLPVTQLSDHCAVRCTIGDW
mmetsp:Transcript_102859/g.235931  ORF Transcript_102859/g.235931 Transcript_102859/m.235931 type:complete len:474 (-) Transcript_102859:229-1650(-)